MNRPNWSVGQVLRHKASGVQCVVMELWDEEEKYSESTTVRVATGFGDDEQNIDIECVQLEPV